MIERGHHDLGGLEAGRVEPTGHDEARSYAEWERRVDALVVLMTGIKGRKVMTVDELRKNIEALPPEAYERMGYYERWVSSVAQTMIQRGIITSEELARKMAGFSFEGSHHDMGGSPAGKVEPTEHDYGDWERRVDALAVLLSRNALTVDQRRRNIEGLPPQAYDAMGYYERWVMSLAQSLLQRGLVTSEELARKLIEVEKRDRG